LRFADIGNAENSFKIKSLVSGLFLETWSSVHLRAASSARRSNKKPEGLSTDTKMTVGFGLQAEDAESGIVEPHRKMCSFVALRRGYWRNRQASPVNRTMPGKRVLPTVGANSATTTLKGLGGIGPAFEGKRSSAGSLAQNTRKADNQTI
jgi:hypothetical protein